MMQEEYVQDRYKVLIVDDDGLLRKALSRTLRGGSYDVLTASDGHEALEKLTEREIAVVLSDYRMPGMTGQQLLEKVRDQYPSTIRIMMSGTDVLYNSAAHYFIEKPFDPVDLKSMIEEGLADYIGNVEERRTKSKL